MSNPYFSGSLAMPAAPPKVQKRRTADHSGEERSTGPERRLELHEAALAAIQAYANDGRPLAVYFRKYDFHVAYGPMEYGPRLFGVIDSDPLVQMFPRCIWADSLHTGSLTDAYAIKDLIGRIDALAALPDEERRRLIDPARRDEMFPIDLEAIASAYELEIQMEAMRQDDDDRIRYYGFWQLFRASSIRGVLMQRGDDSFANRLGLHSAMLQMSAILLDHEKEADRIVLVGDLLFAEQCAQSAYNIIREDDMMGDSLRASALERWETVRGLRAMVEAEPERFILRPRYGTFVVRKA